MGAECSAPDILKDGAINMSDELKEMIAENEIICKSGEDGCYYHNFGELEGEKFAIG